MSSMPDKLDFLSKRARSLLVPFLIFILLFVLAVVVFRNSMNKPLVSDDYYLIDASLSGSGWRFPLSLLRAMAPLYFRLLPLMLFRFQYELFGDAGLPSHLISAAFHAANASLLLLFLKRFRVSWLTASLAACLFLVMPVSTEVVSWSAARFDSIALFFVLLALLLYVSYLQKGRMLLLAGSFACAAAAILSKEEAVALWFLYPAMELLLKDTDMPRDTIKPHRVFKFLSGPGLVTLLASFTVYLFARIEVLGSLGGQYSIVGIPNFDFAMSTGAFSSVGFLLSPLSAFEFSQEAIWSFGFFMAALLVLSCYVVVWRWEKVSLVTRRLWLFMLVFFFANLLPVNWPVLVEGIGHSTQNSRYFYFPVIGFIVVLVLGLLEFGWSHWIWKTCVVLALLFTMQTYMRAAADNGIIWNDFSLFTGSLIRQTHVLVPDPAPDSHLYLVNVPKTVGVWYYGSALDYIIRRSYSREDLKVDFLNQPERVSVSDKNHLLYYNDKTGKLTLDQPSG